MSVLEKLAEVIETMKPGLSREAAAGNSLWREPEGQVRESFAKLKEPTQRDASSMLNCHSSLIPRPDGRGYCLSALRA